MLDWCLRWFINVWLGLVLVLQFIRAAEIVLRAPSIWNGVWEAIDATFNPYHVVHFAVMLLVLSPAFGAFMWLERREQARQAKGVVATPR
jgi:hypothetical protein